MNSTAASPEAMIESFPNRHIPKIIGIPTYKFICATKAALAQNSVSIPTTVIGINNPSAMQVRTHAELLREWREYCNIEQALKKQLADSMDPIYLRAVCDPYVGYNNRSLRELIAHIIGLYGNITPPEFKENDQWFNTPWDPNTPLESLISQIETAVEYANASNQAYTPTQVVNTAFTLIFNTGIYLDECKRWNQRDAAGQTWQDLKTFFLQTTNELRIQQQTAQRAGFHGANAAWGAQLPPQSYDYNDTAEALANLTTATATDRATFATMTATMASLTAQVKAKDAVIATLTQKLAVTSSGTPPTQPTGGRPMTQRIDKGGYCWSHGYCVTPLHTSATCNNKKAGHVNAATRENPMSGSTFDKPP